jgi:mannitol/fructose-specific phosphotransferase system IIA component (Ntr-type)
MLLGEIFDRQLIKLDLEGKTKDEVFMELVESIALKHPEFDRQEMLTAVTTREVQMNTAIIPGVAVPHGYYKAISGIVGAIGFSRAGIEYNSLDQKPVHSIFMLLMDQASREQHLLVLSRLLALLKSKALAGIQAAKSPGEVYDILYQF